MVSAQHGAANMDGIPAAPGEASPGGRARSRPGWFRRCGWPPETRWCVATAWGDAPHARGFNAAALAPIGPAVQLLRPFDCTYPPRNEAHPPSGNTCLTTTPPPTCRFQPDKVVVGQGGTRGVENSKWCPLNMAPPTWMAFQPAPGEASPGGRARSRPGWFRRCGWPSETRWCVATG